MGRPRKVTASDPTSVVGYLRVSTAEQADSGLGLDAQRHAIAQECTRRSWTLVETFCDAGISGKSIAGRTGLTNALQVIESGAAANLIVAKLDRLSRSLGDLCGLMARANAQGWAIVATDMGVDMTTPMGRAMAQMSGVFAELERHLIGQRTRDALAVKRAQGVRLGRPVGLPVEVVERIRRAAADGMGWSAIAGELNREGVPTAQGGSRWWASTVRGVVVGRGRAA